MTEGILRTAMGVYVLAKDIAMSRHIEVHGRLDVSSVHDIAPYAQYIPEGGTVINAGGFLGDHAVVYAQLVGARGHVHVFEPHPLTFEALTLNMARLTNVTTYHAALGLNVGPAILHEAMDRGCSCVMPQGADGTSIQRDGSQAEMRKIPITVNTLDTVFLDTLDRCDLIHLDVEGAEIQALFGGKDLIQKLKPALVLEVGACHLQKWGLSPEQVFDYLNQIGYRANWINAVGQGDGVYNILALPR